MNATLSLHRDQEAPILARPSVADGLLGRIGARIGNGVRAMQYARMLQAMSELTDEQRATLGLSRSDLPRYARECVYGPQA